MRNRAKDIKTKAFHHPQREANFAIEPKITARRVSN
jgi:hypothetical protein